MNDSVRQEVLASIRAQHYSACGQDADGSIVFQAQGLKYCVQFDPESPGRVRLCLPNFYLLDSDAKVRLAWSVAGKCAQVFRNGSYEIQDQLGECVSVCVMEDLAMLQVAGRLRGLAYMMAIMARHYSETMAIELQALHQEHQA